MATLAIGAVGLATKAHAAYKTYEASKDIIDAAVETKERAENIDLARTDARQASITEVDIFCCQLARIAYFPKGERRNVLNNLGFHLVIEKTRWFIAIKTHRGGETKTRQFPSLGFIAFRGTASLRDVITDLAAKPTIPIGTYSASDNFQTAFYPKTQFLSGFFLNIVQNYKLRYALEQCGLIANKAISSGSDESEVAKELRGNDAEYKCDFPSEFVSPVRGAGNEFTGVNDWYFCGHSLGGGSAQLALVLLQKGIFEASEFFPAAVDPKMKLQTSLTTSASGGSVAGGGSSFASSAANLALSSSASGLGSRFADNSDEDDSDDEESQDAKERKKLQAEKQAARREHQMQQASVLYEAGKKWLAAHSSTNYYKEEKSTVQRTSLQPCCGTSGVRVQAIVFASPPLYFDPIGFLDDAESFPRGVSGKDEMRKLWLLDKNHPIKAFVYGMDPVPRLDRQSHNLFLKLVTHYLPSAKKKIKSLDNYTHFQHEKSVWIIPEKGSGSFGSMTSLENLETTWEYGKEYGMKAAKKAKKYLGKKAEIAANAAKEKAAQATERAKAWWNSSGGDEQGDDDGDQHGRDETDEKPDFKDGGGATHPEKPKVAAPIVPQPGAPTITKDSFTPLVAATPIATSQKGGAQAAAAASTPDSAPAPQKRGIFSCCCGGSRPPPAVNGTNLSAEGEACVPQTEGELSFGGLMGKKLGNPEVEGGDDADDVGPPKTRAIWLDPDPEEKFSRKHLLHVNDSAPTHHALDKYELGFMNHFDLHDTFEEKSLCELPLDGFGDKG
ncbi:unnamed protein product [Amoebophrya sp. A25]|nr:unnamed protein product [Amoebophrya sp. A25]|eukprot:GSA25T00006154001.1